MPTLGEDFKQVIEKLRQNRLTPADTDQFAAKLDRVEQTFTPLQKWVTPGGLNVPSIAANTALLTQMPMGGFFIRRDAVQTIPTGTLTEVTWDNTVSTSGSLFTKDPATDTRILISPSVAGHVFLLTGRMRWTANSTGRRRADYLSSVALDSWSMVNIDGPSTTLAIGYTLLLYYTRENLPTYFEIQVQQTSGGNLDLTDFMLGAFLVT